VEEENMAQKPVREDHGDKKLAKLLELEAQITARRETRERQIREQVRGRETRQRILLGAFVLHLVEQDTPMGRQLRSVLAAELSGFLTRPRDKEVLLPLLHRLDREKS
jgi:hypothetical protein